MDEGSLENRKSDKSGQEEIPKGISPLEEISPVAREGTLGTTSHSLANHVSERNGNESLRIGSACLVAEKTPGEDMEV